MRKRLEPRDRKNKQLCPSPGEQLLQRQQPGVVGNCSRHPLNPPGLCMLRGLGWKKIVMRWLLEVWAHQPEPSLQGLIITSGGGISKPFFSCSDSVPPGCFEECPVVACLPPGRQTVVASLSASLSNALCLMHHQCRGLGKYRLWQSCCRWMGASQLLWFLCLRFLICLALLYYCTGDLSASMEGLLDSVLWLKL